MGSLSQAKTMGGIGAILVLVGIILSSLIVIGFVGLILIYIGAKHISEVTNDKSIADEALYGAITGGIGFVILGLLPWIALGSAGMGIGTFATTGDPLAGATTTIAICAITWIIMTVMFIISGIKIKNSFEKITQKTRIDMFKTSGLVFFIGAILTIIGIGLLIILIAAILMIVAFFGLPDSLSPGGMGQPGMSQGGAPGRVCPNCGRPIPNDAQVCPYCGKDFRPPSPK